MNVKVHPLPDMPDVLRLDLRSHVDARGFFVERWRADEAASVGLPPLIQLNHSRSHYGVLRGLHFQSPPGAQAKLVSVIRGTVFDVVVDLRRSSDTYGHWAGITLDDENQQWLWVPQGFAHGFLVLSDVADVLYLVDIGHVPEAEGGLSWDDPDLGIRWPLEVEQRPTVSPKDAHLPRLADLVSPFG